MRMVVLVFAMLLFGYAAVIKPVFAEERDPDLLYRAKCTACHRVYPPRNYTYQKLQIYVARYGKGFSDEERRRILEYLKENAKHEPTKGGEMGNKQDGGEMDFFKR